MTEKKDIMDFVRKKNNEIQIKQRIYTYTNNLPETTLPVPKGGLTRLTIACTVWDLFHNGAFKSLKHVDSFLDGISKLKCLAELDDFVLNYKR